MSVRRQGELSQLIAPLRKPIYLLTRSAIKWSDASVDRWVRELQLACIKVTDDCDEWLGTR